MFFVGIGIALIGFVWGGVIGAQKKTMLDAMKWDNRLIAPMILFMGGFLLAMAVKGHWIQ